MPVTTRAVATIGIPLVFWTVRSALAQTLASSCMEANTARAVIEDKLRELTPRLRGYVRSAACAEGVCTVETDLMPADPAEPISDPVAPPPPPVFRLAFDLGAGLRSKA